MTICRCGHDESEHRKLHSGKCGTCLAHNAEGKFCRCDSFVKKQERNWPYRSAERTKPTRQRGFLFDGRNE